MSHMSYSELRIEPNGDVAIPQGNIFEDPRTTSPSILVSQAEWVTEFFRIRMVTKTTLGLEPEMYQLSLAYNPVSTLNPHLHWDP